MSTAPAYEPMLVELSRWFGRVLQYGTSHPSCVAVAKQTHGLLITALEEESPLAFGVLRDELVLGEVAIRHRAVRDRLAPFLHERGVLVLRFARGVSVDELTAFVEVMASPASAIFDAGGLSRLLIARGVSRVQIEEIGHDITTEEREEHRRRKQFRAFFSDMLKKLLADRADLGEFGGLVVELLEHPDIAVAILEERSAAGIAESAAGLALMAKETEVRTGTPLLERVCIVLRSLSPSARVNVLTGAPSLMGEFRKALLWAVEGLSEDELAHFAFPSVRVRHAQLDDVLYALGVLVARNARRLTALRRVAIILYDLAIDDPETIEVLGDLARRPPEHDSFRSERLCLVEAAERALALRALASPPTPEAGASIPPGHDVSSGERRAVAEVLVLSATADGFERMCGRLPRAAAAMSTERDVDGVIGLVDGLGAVAGSTRRGPPEEALRAIVTSSAAEPILRELDRASGHLEGDALEPLVATLRVLVTRNAGGVFDQLVRSESRKMRRILLDTLPLAGGDLLPVLRAKLHGASWFVARNIALLLPRAGGTTSDLSPLARHPHEKVRLEVVRALRGVTDERAAMNVLCTFLTDTSHEIRQTALSSLRGELLAAEAVAALEQVAADDHGAEDLRRRVVQTLGRSPEGAAAEALFRLIQPHGLIDMGASAALRDTAAASLRASPAPAAKKLFDEGLHSSVRRVRKACERAAGGST